MTTLAGLGRLEMGDAAAVPRGWLARTVVNGSVHVDVGGCGRSEAAKAAHKLRKLNDSFQKLRATTETAGYRASAPAHVQQLHANKLADLRRQIDELETYCRSLETAPS